MILNLINILWQRIRLLIQIKSVCGYNKMSQSSESSGAKRRERSRSEEKVQSGKLFITNLDGKAELTDLENELRRLFEKYGTVLNVVAKRNRNSQYCFAFADMKDHLCALECVKAYDQSNVNGKPIKVEFQDDTKRRKDSKQRRFELSKGCYNCGKMGHFARQCHSARLDSGRGHRRRSRSRSQESDRHRKSKRRHRSDSSDRGRSRSPKSKKDRKNRSRDRDEKRKKRHKRSSSDS